MDFSLVQSEYRRLKGQFDAGKLSETDFRGRLQDLMFEDEQGRWWIIGYETGQWYVHDGKRWIPSEPPRTVPPVSIESPVAVPDRTTAIAAEAQLSQATIETRIAAETTPRPVSKAIPVKPQESAPVAAPVQPSVQPYAATAVQKPQRRSKRNKTVQGASRVRDKPEHRRNSTHGCGAGLGVLGESGVSLGSGVRVGSGVSSASSVGLGVVVTGRVAEGVAVTGQSVAVGVAVIGCGVAVGVAGGVHVIVGTGEWVAVAARVGVGVLTGVCVRVAVGTVVVSVGVAVAAGDGVPVAVGSSAAVAVGNGGSSIAGAVLLG